MTNDIPTAGRMDGRTHVLPVRIYYEDTDFSGLVYHANYLRYFERGRSEFLRFTNVSHTDLLEGDSPTAFAVNKMTIDFLKPARIDDALTVRTTFDSFRGARLFATQALARESEVLVKADVQACCISLTGRPKKPPRLLLDRVKPYLDPSASTF